MLKKTFIFIAFLASMGITGYGQAPTFVFSPTTLPDASYGSGYGNQTIAVSGGTAPYAFSITSGNLPPGMNMSPNGTISGAPTAVGLYSFTVTAQDNSPAPGPYSQSQDYTLNVDPAVLTVTANNANMNYGGAFPALNLMYSGFVNGDNPNSLSTQPTPSTSATATSGAGTYPITPTGGSSANYTFNYVAGTLTINPVPLTITANNQSMTYGGTAPAFTITYNGFVNGDNSSSLTTQPTVTTTAAPSLAAGTYPITVAGAVDPNYTITYHAGTLTIAKAPLTVTANNEAMPLGGPLPALTISYTGFVNGDNASNLTTAPTATTPATASSPAGSYPINVGGGASSNYVLSYVNGTLSVAQAVLTITANPASSVYGAPLVAPGALTVTYSGFVNGDGPNNLTKKPTVANTATAGSPAGTYTLTPSGAADPNYAIQYATGVYTIQPANLTITANNQAMTYGGTMPALSLTYTGFVNGDKATSLTTPPAVTTTGSSSAAAGTYPITVSGAVDPNYTITYVPGTLTIGTAALTVTAAAEKKVYGTPDPTFTYTATGFVNGDNSSLVSGGLGRTPGENVGTYPINIGTLSAGSNYTIHFTGNNLTITIASQTITWNQTLVVGCNATTQVQLNATASSGLPVTYSVSNTGIATVAGSVLTLLKPGTTVVTARQAGDANHTAAPPVMDTVLYEASSLIVQHWDDVIFFDNSSGDYVAWQWYKNDSLITGATEPYYSEQPSLNGQYFVIATNKAGQQVESCTLTIKPGAAIPGGIKVLPNPAGKGQMVTVNCNYSSAALQGAVLKVVDLSGKVWQQITNVQAMTQVTAPSASGIYIINLVLSNGTTASVNLLVMD